MKNLNFNVDNRTQLVFSIIYTDFREILISEGGDDDLIEYDENLVLYLLISLIRKKDLKIYKKLNFNNNTYDVSLNLYLKKKKELLKLINK